MQRTMGNFVGERGRNAALPVPPGERAGGTKWVVRPVVGRRGAKEVGVGR